LRERCFLSVDVKLLMIIQALHKRPNVRFFSCKQSCFSFIFQVYNANTEKAGTIFVPAFSVLAKTVSSTLKS